MKIRRALISVSNKDGILELARGLSAQGIELLSTGGTAAALKREKIPIRDVSDFTGFPEMMDGRIKTLHPKVHGGILARRDLSSHLEAMKTHGIEPIDLVCVNLYPFQETVRKPGCKLEEAVEQIDIGGPTMLRSAAKNFEHVVVLVDPLDYSRVLDAMKKHGGEVPREMRLALAQKVFHHTAVYDGVIANYLEREIEGEEAVRFPNILTLQFEKVQNLRYGENPHQQGAFYREFEGEESSIAAAHQLQGKAMSFNNYLDANAALELVREFRDVASVIVKHNNPCGVALGDSLAEAFLRAKETDPVSAFGGVIAFNHPVDEETAKEITSMFVEIVVAPGFEPEALELFKKKKDLRLLDIGPKLQPRLQGMDLKRVVGGLILQDRDLGVLDDIRSLKVATRRSPTDEEFDSLAFAWVVCKHVKSNAIVYARDGRTVGIGAGQMSRVDSVKLGAMKARSTLEGTVLASDAFFPFRDGIDEASRVGVTAVIQPGGSIRDEEVIGSANEHDMAMVMTGMRHFRH
jgi:phosphoribosylaminoimidazolecarboxamide formyltransferase/IMP cyclohydrolase